MGATITRSGMDKDKLVEEMKEQLKGGINCGLFPDSHMSVIELKMVDGKLMIVDSFAYDVDYDIDQENGTGVSVTLKENKDSLIELKQKDSIAVAVSQTYYDPKNDKYVACVHMD